MIGIHHVICMPQWATPRVVRGAPQAGVQQPRYTPSYRGGLCCIEDVKISLLFRMPTFHQ
jgi:hypothetical protein